MLVALRFRFTKFISTPIGKVNFQNQCQTFGERKVFGFHAPTKEFSLWMLHKRSFGHQKNERKSFRDKKNFFPLYLLFFKYIQRPKIDV